jgi:hypothetical protein
MDEKNSSSGVASRYANLSRRDAALVLAVFFLLTAWGLAISWGQQPKLNSGKGKGDLALYSSVVERLSHGEAYYDALGTELRAREYPTQSPFNWRTPLHLEILANLPKTAWAQYLLGFGAVLAVGLAVARPFRSGEYGLVVWQTLLLGFPLAIAGMYPVYFFAEMWTGVVIAISVGLHAVGWRKLGAGTGVLALFFRELALPYVLIGLVLAWRQKKKSELWTWIAGLAAFAVYFGLHVMAVTARIPSADHGTEVSRWVQFGGLRFLLITSRVGLLQLYPFWWSAIYLPCALLGLAGWRHPLATRILATVAAYLLAFSVIGIPSANYYWGAIYAPLLGFGTASALSSLKDLFCAVAPANWTAAPQLSPTETPQ